MDATTFAPSPDHGRHPDRPTAFLVSTTGCAGDIRRHMGSADYSYAFVLEALRPVLERLGTWQLIDRPESRLDYAAAQAARAGYRPVHLALHPPQNIHHSPTVPTVLFPFWEFPQIPDRDFQHDTRQNWARMCRTAALILTASHDTANAFRRAGVRCPIEVVPVPVAPAYFEVPDWDPAFRWSLDCRHLAWGGPGETATPTLADLAPPIRPVGPRRRVVHALRTGYHRHVRPWLSERSLRGIARVKRAVLRRPEPPRPRLPVSPLTLDGLVFTSIFNFSDRRKNPRDQLTAFLLAFRDRPDVTLVWKLATSATREWIEMQELEALYRGLKIDHACRFVVITDFLTDEQLAGLYRATTYYLNSSHAEGACLPLQRALAAGRPAIAPNHTAMADYMDEQTGFVVGSHPEPTFWPHDPDRRYETTWHRLVWSDLRDSLLRAAELAELDGASYDALSAHSRARMADVASCDVTTRLLARHLRHVPGFAPDQLERVA